MGVESGITRPAWEAAYGQMGGSLDRQRQVDLLVDDGHHAGPGLPRAAGAYRAAPSSAPRPACWAGVTWSTFVSAATRSSPTPAIDPLLDAIAAHQSRLAHGAADLT